MNFQQTKFSQYKPKKRDRSRRSSPTGLSSLMTGALSRHGIQKQVGSAMVVQKAQELLNMALEPHMAADIRVISYHKGILFIACRYAEAAHALKPFIAGLDDTLTKTFPSIKLSRIDHRFRPHSFSERGHQVL